MRNLVVALLLVMALPAAADSLQVSPETAAQVARYRNLRQADPAAARAWIEQVLDTDPPPALAFLAANDFAEAGEPDAAIEILNALLTTAPDFPRARRNRAILLARTGRYRDAVDDLLAVIEGDGRDPELMLVLGACYDRLDQPGAAETAYRWAQLHAPASPGVNLSLARSLYAQELFGAAERAASAAIDRGAENLAAWRLRVAALLRLDRPGDAITVLETARQLQGKLPQDLEDCLVDLYLSQGLSAPAAAILLARPEAVSPERLTAALQAALHGGDGEIARKLTQALVSQRPEAPVCWYYAALAAEREGSSWQARRYLQEALDRQADFLPALLQLARLDILVGNDADALDHLRAAAALPEGDVPSFELQLALRWRRQQWEDARDLARQLARRQPLEDWDRVAARLDELLPHP